MLISAIVVVLLWGLPALVAAYPAVCALIQRRPGLAVVLFVVGEVIAFIVPAIVDRWQTAELTRRGYIADSIAFIFYPWVYSLPWAFVGAVAVAIVGRKSKSTPEANTDPPGGVAPWIADMRRVRARKE